MLCGTDIIMQNVMCVFLENFPIFFQILSLSLSLSLIHTISINWLKSHQFTFMFSNFYQLDLHNKPCFALANLRWSTINDIKTNSLDIVCAIEVHVCSFFIKVHKSSQFVFNIKFKVVNRIWKRSPIFFKHVSSWCLLFDPHQITQESNIGIRLKGGTQ